MTTLDKPTLPLKAGDWAAPADIGRLQKNALIAAGIGIVASVAGWATNAPVFFRAYLVAWLFVVGIAVGCLALSLLHHLTGGAWGRVMRRSMEAATRTLPYVALLAIPILLGMKDIYVWARPEVVAADPLLQAKHAYLNVGAFTFRLVLYFAIWSTFGFILDRMERQQDAAYDPERERRMQLIAAPGLGLYCLATTFASIDWLMSLQPHWSSTIYGVYFLGGQGLSALAFLIVFAMYLARRPPMDTVLAPRHFHDYGKLFLAFVMLWAYFAFSQFLIVWGGNLPEEIVWYLKRIRHGWGYVAVALVLFHFAMPFLLLLSRGLKEVPKRLGGLAAFMLLMRWLDLYWQAEPAFPEGRSLHFHWLFLATLVAVGGVWLALFFAELKKRPLLPLTDPHLPEGMGHE